MKRRPARPGHRLAAGLLSATTLCVGLTLVCVPAASAAPDWTVVAQDSFARSVPSGWGSADKGGSWVLNNGGGAAVRVTGGVGSVASLPAGRSFVATLPAVSARDVRSQVTLTFPQIGSGAWTTYQALDLRRQADGSVYRGRLRMDQNGRAALGVFRSGPGGDVALESVDLPGRFTAGQRIVVQFEATGTDPVAVNGRAWVEGSATPYWQVEVRDSAAGRIVRAGSVGTWEYSSIGGGATVTTDDFTVGSADQAAPPTSPPTGASTSAPSTVQATSAPSTAASTPVPSTATASPTITMIDPTSSQMAPPPTTAPSTAPPTTATPGIPSPPADLGRPDASNTGVPAGTVLTRYTGPLTITQDGTVIDGKEVYGDLKIRARNVVIKNSYLHCGPDETSYATGCVDANHWDVYNLTVERNLIKPDRPTAIRDGIVGHEFTARYNHILNTSDGIGIFNRPGGSSAANVRVEGNYIHDMTHWNSSPYQTDGTHNDGIEIQGGENIAIVGNTIIGSAVAGDGLGKFGRFSASAIIVTQNTVPVKNLVIEKNWLDGGGATLRIQYAKFDTVTLTVRDNLFGRDRAAEPNNSQFPIRIYSQSRSIVDGLYTNRWMDTGAFLADGRDLGIRYNAP